VSDHDDILAGVFGGSGIPNELQKKDTHVTQDMLYQREVASAAADAESLDDAGANPQVAPARNFATHGTPNASVRSSKDPQKKVPLRKQSVYFRPEDDELLDSLHGSVKRAVGRGGHLGATHYTRIGLAWVNWALKHDVGALRRISAIVRSNEESKEPV